MNPSFDVLVVGGGPAGSAVARTMASKGYRTGVLEEHASSGVPTQCAGLVTDEVIRTSGVSPRIYNTLYGAEVVFPDGESIEVRSASPKARVVDRADLDRLMAEAAADSGAEFFYGDRYASHSVSGDGASVRSASGERLCRAVVGADGHTSAVARSMGAGPVREYVRGIQMDLPVAADRQDVFRIRIGRKYAPGFFSWEIPCGDFTRVGLCTSWSEGPPYEYLKALVDDLYPGAKPAAKHCGKIPLGGRGLTYGDRCLLIGDAAVQVKPVSGGGLYPALRAVPMLSDVLSSALDSDDLSAKRLSRYERMWRKDFGKSLDRAYRLRRMYVRFSDEKLSRAGAFACRDDVHAVLNDIDLDDPGKVVGRLMRSSALVPGLLLLARCLL